MPRRRTTVNNAEKLVKAGVLGRPIQEVILTQDTTAEELRLQLNFGEVRTVKASKNGTTNFREIDKGTKINGYKSILFVPATSGGC